MALDDDLRGIALKLSSGGKPHKTTPRKLLAMFSLKRRGAFVVEEVTSRLARHNLKAEPSILEVGIDDPIALVYSGTHSSFIERLEDAAREAKDGHPRVISVKEFLRWFGFERRAALVCEQIQAHLHSFELVTEPDFQSVPIDAEVALLHSTAVEPQAENVNTRPVALPSEVVCPSPTNPNAATPVEGTSHTTFRIGTLNEANRSVVHVRPQSTLREAVSMMLTHQVSHIPILRNERTVIGLVRWKDLGKYLLMSSGSLDDPVEKAMSRPREVPADTPFLSAIPEVIQYGCVLVRSAEQKITGIVTKKDLGRRLNELARPFVTLGEIERCLRWVLEQGNFTNVELREIRDPNDDRPVNSVADLTLGEYQRLLQRDSTWERVGLRIDRKVFNSALEQVRRVRNDIMHFDPESPTEEDNIVLNKFLNLVYELRQFGDC